ncbi:hypothetical protein KXJ75_11025 [Aeromonas sanarellii]|nr:hypothetical protein KXJ75_11025 [Aeromonas sanarellii]
MMHGDSRVMVVVCLETASLPAPCLSTSTSPGSREEPFFTSSIFFLLSVTSSVALAEGKNGEALREFSCETAKHRILIDSTDNKSYRYRSWNKPKAISEKPDVELTDQRAWRPQGSGACSYTAWDFSRGNVNYLVFEPGGCGEAPASGEPEDHGELVVMIDDVEKLRLRCQ